MNRRALLATFATGVSGCLSNSGSPATQPSRTDEPTNTVPSPPPGAEHPPNFDDVDEVTYPASTGGRVTLTVEPADVELPDATVEFEAANTSSTTFRTNLYHWRLHKRVAGQWWDLGVYFPLHEPYSLEPQESHTYTVTIDNGQLDRLAQSLSPSATGSFTLVGVGAGRYAFSLVGRFENATSDRAFSTPFELTGESVEIRPEPGLETARDGDTVDVRRARDDKYDYEFRAEWRDGGDDAPPLVPEWGLRHDGVRNTVPFLSDEVRTVVYSSDNLLPPQRPLDGETFAYDDAAVEFTLREI